MPPNKRLAGSKTGGFISIYVGRRSILCACAIYAVYVMLIVMRDVDGQKTSDIEFANARKSLFPEFSNPLTAAGPIKAPKIDKEDDYVPPHPGLTYIKETSVQVEAPKDVLSKKFNSKKALIIGSCSVAILGISLGGFFVLKPQKKQALTLPTVSQSKAPTVPQSSSIAVYVPRNLPSGYTYNNDQKMIKTNVYYSSINGPKGEIFYITQQPIPTDFDFTAFNKKFLNPDTFNSNAGTATVGLAGTSFIASVRTNKNSWIIINSPASKSAGSLEAVVRSLTIDN
jgi:hypothetical protein